MSPPIVRIEHLSKQYSLGRRPPTRSLREAFAAAPKSIRLALEALLGKRQAEQKFWALKDVCFDIEKGEVLGIIGRNGAGKSTLLKILSRITEPTAGRVQIRGRVASLLEVGTGFHPELTGRENIYLNGAILGMSRSEIQRRFDQIVAFAETEKFLDTPVKFYSSGMYVRLAFAVAAHLEPEILIVDEVLAVGDVQFQKKCLGKIKDVAREEGRTVLFVSHNMGAVTSLCDRAVYLMDGQVELDGSAEAVIASYYAQLVDERGDLSQFRVPVSGYGSSVRFRRIELVSDGDGNLRFGEPLHYTLELEADTDLKNLRIGCSIFDSSDICVGGLFSGPFAIEAGQTLVLSLSVANPNLAPGTYRSGFSVGYGGPDSPRHDLDAIVGRPAFHVLPIATAAGQVANWSPGWGRIVFQDVQFSVGE
ncbi:ABC transporter ATP-binding protein [Gloeobacter kilaueensis]|uniref:ABC transporter n=1 Tax=Gloeobacter kilaueensis (strain ATCC BAA-2537 / CCAP 1431/1 / ULC 316 / JS1) TaxID=1183438 RepID=U5QQ07_GLOK1|nr:ABC transporter ATP-binding protein [Gloeobacter kilaueensis]AGY59714.1 ABC transporter [Gloeobacter kilaueensis JS1]